MVCGISTNESPSLFKLEGMARLRLAKILKTPPGLLIDSESIYTKVTSEFHYTHPYDELEQNWTIA
jgi:hypothetical protein